MDNLTRSILDRERYGNHNYIRKFSQVLEYKTANLSTIHFNYDLQEAARSTFVIAFSPDRTKIATSHGNHTVKISDCLTFKVLLTLKGHPRTPWCVTFHPRINSLLASGCLGGQVRVWDLTKVNDDNIVFQSQAVISSLTFHPIDDVLAISTHNKIIFYDWNTQQILKTIQMKHHSETIRLIRFLPNGRKLITGITNASSQYCRPERLNVSTRGDPHGNSVVQTVSCMRMQQRTQEEKKTQTPPSLSGKKVLPGKTSASCNKESDPSVQLSSTSANKPGQPSGCLKRKLSENKVNSDPTSGCVRGDNSTVESSKLKKRLFDDEAECGSLPSSSTDTRDTKKDTGGPSTSKIWHEPYKAKRDNIFLSRKSSINFFRQQSSDPTLESTSSDLPHQSSDLPQENQSSDLPFENPSSNLTENLSRDPPIENLSSDLPPEKSSTDSPIENLSSDLPPENPSTDPSEISSSDLPPENPSTDPLEISSSVLPQENPSTDPPEISSSEPPPFHRRSSAASQRLIDNVIRQEAREKEEEAANNDESAGSSSSSNYQPFHHRSRVVDNTDTNTNRTSNISNNSTYAPITTAHAFTSSRNSSTLRTQTNRASSVRIFIEENNGESNEIANNNTTTLSSSIDGSNSSESSDRNAERPYRTNRPNVGRQGRSEIWNFNLGPSVSSDQISTSESLNELDISVEGAASTIPVHGYITFPFSDIDQSTDVTNLLGVRTAVATATARSSHHVHTAVVIASQENENSETTLQTAVNRAIAGAFAGSGEGAVANNIIDTTHRLQLWDSYSEQYPDIQNESKNIIVPVCKIHNDSSFDISEDSSCVAVFVPSEYGFPNDAQIKVISLKPETFLQCIYSRKYGPNAVSVSLSSLNNYLMIGLASRKLDWQLSSNQLIGQILKLPTNTDVNREDKSKPVLNIQHRCNQNQRSNVSVNTLRFHPIPGMGILYGTNRGHVQHCHIEADIRLTEKWKVKK